MKKSILAPIVFLTLFLGGCVSVPMAPNEADSQAKTFTTEPGKANIYVYRNETMGGAIAMPVNLNGEMAGKTGPNTYFMWSVDPGKHVIQSVTENTSEITIDARAGQNHFVWQEVKMGVWMARSLLQEVSEEQGRAGVLECKLIASEL